MAYQRIYFVNASQWHYEIVKTHTLQSDSGFDVDFSDAAYC